MSDVRNLTKPNQPPNRKGNHICLLYPVRVTLLAAVLSVSTAHHSLAQPSEINFPSIGVECDLAINNLIVSTKGQSRIVLSLLDTKTGKPFAGNLKATFWELTATGPTDLSRVIKPEAKSTYTPPLFTLEFNSWKLPIKSLAAFSLKLCRDN